MTEHWQEQEAVDCLELDIIEAALEAEVIAADEADMTIAIPLTNARLLLTCARRGLPVGQGKGRTPLSLKDRMERAALYSWARARKKELVPEIGATAAHRQASREAEALAGSLNISSAYISRRMD
jgi:hypothetical protein